MRYRETQLDALIDAINATGYGLTHGIQTRVDETVEFVSPRMRAGNIYVNRNIIGAVVGVQPFGGEGLSGTGPKAGGPLYLPRLCRQRSGIGRAEGAARAGSNSGVAWQRDGAAMSLPADDRARALCDWLAARPSDAELARRCRIHLQRRPPAGPEVLPGPTGERNSYALVPRSRVLCLGETRADLLEQLAVVLTAGARAAWPTGVEVARWLAELPGAVRDRVSTVADPFGDDVDAALIEASAERVAVWGRRLAERAGPIVALHVLPADAGAFEIERLLVERTLSVNTAAAGGNASLMTIG